MKSIILLGVLLVTIGCKSSRVGSTENVQLRFLDDYVIPADLEIGDTEVGGLSDIDFHKGSYFLVSDDPVEPRFYKAQIDLEGEKISDINIEEVVKIDQKDKALRSAHLDLEGILFNAEEETFYFSSEGAINKGKDPMLFETDTTGSFLESFEVPENLLAESVKEPRNNGSFEGLARAYDGQGIWAAMELPLVTDGPKPKLIRTKSPVRITYFDKETGEAIKQFPYRLEPIAKIPWLYFAVNGVTDLLEYEPDKFLVIERGFASGHGMKGNTVRIFDVDANLGTNTLDRDNLRVTFYNPAEKELLYDFKWAKKYLDQKVIDNIEGVTFGPVLPNGNKTLILISDNNFNSIGKQLNQVILMEFIQKNK